MIDKLMGQVRACFEKMTDPRKGKNIQYSFADVGMAAYSVFHMQSPSFLAHQDRLKKKFAAHNGQTLFGFKDIPTDNQIRSLMDHVDPNELAPLYDDLLQNVDLSGFKDKDGLVVALDGVYFFSSQNISCECCLKRDHQGSKRYHHAMMVPALIHKDQKCALPLGPEFISNQDGTEKQDCEINAAKRWIQKKKAWLEANHVTILGDDLFSHSPLVREIMALQNVRFVFVAKEASHPHLTKWIKGYAQEDVERHQTTEEEGRKKQTYHYDIYRSVPLSGDIKAPDVTYFEMTVKNRKGEVIYRNTFVTNHAVTKETVHQIGCMGRRRWRIENEAFNVMKTKGYNLEHNFGHGEKNLANVFASLNLIAFLIHHISEVVCDMYRTARACYTARVRFFQSLNFALSIQVFSSWREFLIFFLDISMPAPKPPKGSK